MVRVGKSAVAAALAVLGLGLTVVPRANAAYIVDLSQDGANVVATGSGSIDTAGLSFFFRNGQANGAIIPSGSTITLGPTGPVDWYTGYTGPANFGSGGGVSPSSETGSSVTLYYSSNWLGLPAGYTSLQLRAGHQHRDLGQHHACRAGRHPRQLHVELGQRRGCR